MSLLHQVLQDIDRREPVTALPGALSAPAEQSRRFPVLTVVVTLVVVAVFVAFVLMQRSGLPQGAVEPALVSRAATAAVPQVAENKAAENKAVTLTEAPAVTAEKRSSEAEVSDAPEQLPQVVAEERIAAPVAAVKALSADRAEYSEAVPAARVIRRHSDAQQKYLSALTALQNGQADQALLAVEQALALNSAPDYRTLKLRILLEQSDRQAFVDYYRAQRSDNDEHWLAVAAPGLHMLGYAADAVVPYQQLIVLQPGVVNWPLALAAAWEAQGKPLPARSVLENTLMHYSLTPEQRRWVTGKIQQLR
ncbi:MAG: hypothetical protein KYX62_14300 [Pseudomonadota bacterium]|nr:hypothetical protein [Pseudomonadota bacterium]